MRKQNRRVKNGVSSTIEPHEVTPELIDAFIRRIDYRPTYSFGAWLGGGVEMYSRASIPDSESPNSIINDEWADPNMPISDLESVVKGCLTSAIDCAIHEVLEWFSVDGKRLVEAHNTEVMAKAKKTGEALAAWAWRNRKRLAGHPYPTSEPEEA